MARVNQTGLMTGSHAAAGRPRRLSPGQRLELLDRARVYACGITPMTSPISVTRRRSSGWTRWPRAALPRGGPEVCRNVTDVDDVLVAAARRAGAAYDAFAAIQQFQFDRDMAALSVRAPEHEPRAHRYVDRSSGWRPGCSTRAPPTPARAASTSAAGRGRAGRPGAGRALAAVRGVRRPAGRPGQGRSAGRGRLAASEPGHPAWDSPWGNGRPGWHAECAAMAMSVFGPAVDVHAGGADLRFPHHAYHAAMAEAFTGVRRTPGPSSVWPWSRRRHQDGQVGRQPRAGQRRAHRAPGGCGAAVTWTGRGGRLGLPAALLDAAPSGWTACTRRPRGTRHERSGRRGRTAPRARRRPQRSCRARSGHRGGGRRRPHPRQRARPQLRPASGGSGMLPRASRAQRGTWPGCE